MVFSATKGVASTVIHRLADRGLLSYDEPVAEYWPEFAANGKADITVREVLRHRSGLSHLRGVTKTELMDHLLMEERLAAAPVDHLRGVQAYHALTYGWLLSGLARAVTGKGMRELIREEVARPLNTDGLHLGRPPEGAPDQAGADPDAAEDAHPGIQLHRTEGGRSALLGRPRRDVLPRGHIPHARGTLRSWTARCPRPTAW